MLIIWTSADADTVRKIIGPIVGRECVEHRVESDMDTLPTQTTGDVILACGGKALATLLALSMVPKNRTITSLRDKPLPGSRSSIFMTFDPSIVRKDYARLPEIQWDTALAIRQLKTGSTAPPIGVYRFVESLHDLIEQVDAEYDRTGKAVPVSADLETVGLDEYNEDAYIVACSFTIVEGKSDVLYLEVFEVPTEPEVWADIEECQYWQALWIQLHWMFTTGKIALRGANFKFDSRWIFRKWGIDVTNLKMDTMLVGSLIDENRSNSLKLHAKVYTPMGGYEDDMKSVMAAMGITMGEIQKLPKPKILNYVGGDTDATHRVGNVLRTELLKDRQLADFYVKVLHPSSKVFERMERNGVHLDVPYYRKLQVELEVEISRLDGLMKKMIPRKLAIKYQDNFSLTRDVLMREYLFTPAGLNLKPTVFTAKTGEPSTAIDHLLTFSDVPEAKQFIDLLKESNSASKTLNTFVVGFLKHLRSDGRFHAHYRLARGEFGGGKDEGAVTGRTSCTDPALQTVPKHTKWTKRLRRALTPPEGKTILQCVHPDTKIWMANLSWKRAADLTLGEELFAFDEEAPATKHRKMRTATVDGLVLQKAKRIRLVFADGTSVICADHHKWLSFNSSQNIWRETKKLKIGDCIRRITKVYAPDRSFGAGWLSGIFDGEGWLSGRHGDGWALGVGQKEGITLDSIRAGLTARGHEFRESTNGQGVKCLRLCDTFDVFRFLQEVRPERLVAKRTWEGYALPRMGTVGASTYQSRIVAIYPAGFDTVVSIKTSTGTYVAEGLASHNCDYSQGELKITACLAEEPTMLQSYLNGVDLHAVTAAKLNGYSMDEFMLLPDDVRDDLRSGGKAGNFGLIYGMGAVGYQAYALTSYGVKLTEEEAFKQREAFFELYNRLPKWHTEFKSRAKQLGHIRSPLGRIRHLPLITSKDNEARSQAERQAVNSPVQSCLSDMMQLAMILIDREYGSQVEMFMMTHDSCAFYVPLGEEVVWAKRLKAIMDNLPLKAMFGWDHQLQFTTDAECCVPDSEGVLSFAYLKKMKGL